MIKTYKNKMRMVIGLVELNLVKNINNNSKRVFVHVNEEGQGEKIGLLYTEDGMKIKDKPSN